MTGQLRRVLDQAYRTPDTVPLRRLATVDAVDAASASVTVTWADGGTSAVVPHLSTYPPRVGDVVVVDVVAGAPLVLGGVWLPRPDPVSDTVTTSQGTTSTTYTDLATAGPAVTVQAAAGQIVKVWIRARAVSNLAGPTASAMGSFAVSGMVTVAATDADAFEQAGDIPSTCFSMALFPVTVTGSHTFTMKYKRVNGTTATFFNRRIVAQVE